MNKYRVRNFPLHRALIRGEQKVIDFYAPGDAIELDEIEYARYARLLETEEQYQARQKLIKATIKGATK